MRRSTAAPCTACARLDIPWLNVTWYCLAQHTDCISCMHFHNASALIPSVGELLSYGSVGMMQIWAREGLGGLYAGFAPCMLRSVPANAVSFAVYEAVRGFLN